MNQHFLSTIAAESRCPRCRKPILTALDEGSPARVDTTPLPDRASEIAALLDNRATYTLTRNQHLIYRDAHRITANTLQGTIHAEHTCTRPTQLTLDDLIGNK
ncbi:hypothetical protein [Salinispora cortesiana]|uniref:hypothetical protein n=1 Tax=Salinispora cortesiana TaxID=1305843 RepID=UPI000426266E|nr:hypothetical protein [Salinispora cortesiana]